MELGVGTGDLKNVGGIFWGEFDPDSGASSFVGLVLEEVVDLESLGFFWVPRIAREIDPGGLFMEGIEGDDDEEHIVAIGGDLAEGDD